MGSSRIKIWLRGSIVEPIVAIVILVTTIGMAFTVLSKVNIAPSIMAINKAAELINQEVFQVYVSKDYLDKEITDGAFTLVKKISQEKKTSVINIQIVVFDASKKLIASKRLTIFDIEVNKETTVADEN